MKALAYTLLFFPLLLFSQGKHLDLYLNSSLNNKKEIKLIYNDANVVGSGDDQYSQILSNKLFRDLVKKGFIVASPQEFKDICSNNCLNVDDINKNANFIYFYIESQNSGGRTTIDGVIYQESKIIGGFTSFRSYWTNSRYDKLSGLICNEL